MSILDDDLIGVLCDSYFGEDKYQPRRGDVIGVHRAGGIYDHYGVYESDKCVYEYAADSSDFGDAVIRKSTLKKFIGDSGNLFVLDFPEEYCKPKKKHISIASEIFSGKIASGVELLSNLLEFKKRVQYHLYSPDETIERARSRLGENKYNLAFNNCEHFAIWCKTGISESHQMDGLLDIISGYLRCKKVSKNNISFLTYLYEKSIDKNN